MTLPVHAGVRRIPFNLVSGFLGSGKTTLINRLLAAPPFADCAVIVNELGEVGIDHLLYETRPESVALLANGCLCCRLRSDLPEALARLERRRRELGLGPFARVLLEASGGADPAPVLQSLLSDPALAGGYRLDSVVVTADALHLPAQIERFPECARQLALADRIVLTKTDLAPRALARACRALLRAQFPGARVCTRAQAAAQPARLLGAGLYDPARGRLQPRAWLGVMPDASHVVHARALQSFAIRLESRPAWAPLQAWLGTLLALQGERILRLKGIVWLAGRAAPVALHAVHHQMHAPADLAGVGGVPEGSVLVFVTDGLSRADVLASLAGWGLA